MVMYANEFKTKEKQKLAEIKKINGNIYVSRVQRLHLFSEGFEMKHWCFLGPILTSIRP